MNKSLRNAIPGIIFVAWAVALKGAAACSSFHHAFEAHSGGIVDLSPTCLQPVDGNYSSWVSFLPSTSVSYADSIVSIHTGQMVIAEAASDNMRALVVRFKLNQRPRKTLGYATPAEQLQASVALTG